MAIFEKFPWPLRRLFYLQASTQIENGLTMTGVLEDFKDRMKRRHRKGAVKVADEVLKKLRDGGKLADALKPYVSDIELSLLGAGEQAGNVPRALKAIVETKDREKRIYGKLKSSMASPAIYFVTGFLTLWFIGAKTIPQFAELVPVEKWQGWAKLMYWMGAFATGWGMVFSLGSMVLMGFGLAKILPRWTGPTRDIFDRNVFPFTVYREANGFTWITAFVSMIRSGMVDTIAIEEQIKMSKPWLASQLVPIKSSLRNGENLFTAISKNKSNFPSPELIDEIKAYAAFPDFAEKISIVVNTYTESFEKRLMSMGTMIGAVFSGGMFFMFIVIQLGANDLSSMAGNSVH